MRRRGILLDDGPGQRRRLGPMHRRRRTRARVSVSADREQRLATLLRISQPVRRVLPGIAHGAVATRVEHVRVSIQIVGNVVRRQRLEWKCRVNALVHVWEGRGDGMQRSHGRTGRLVGGG